MVTLKKRMCMRAYVYNMYMCPHGRNIGRDKLAKCVLDINISPIDLMIEVCG